MASSPMFGTLLFAVFLLFANGFFVAAEFALVKVRSTQLDVQAQAGHRTASIARGILDHLDGYLSATQLGITLASLGLGWIAEPAVQHLLEPLFAALGVEVVLAEKISFVVGFAFISFFHIVVGEVAPKSLAIAHPVAISMFVALPMQLFYFAFRPALVVMNGTSNLLLRMIGVQPASTHSLAVPAEELMKIAEESVVGGQLTRGEGDLLTNVFTFSDRVAREIMVPRNKVLGLDLQQPVEEIVRFAFESGHTRYPVFEADLDQIVGVLHIKDLLPKVEVPATATRELDPEGARLAVTIRKSHELRALLRPPLFVPEAMPAQRLLRMFQRQRTHLAVVLDEYGGVAGITTLEDALEELVGEIQDEYDEERAPVESLDNGFSVAGTALLTDLEDLLDIHEIDSDASTVAGYLMEKLERVPRVGDVVDLPGWEVRVAQVDGRAVERVDLIRLPAIANA